jgi:hypothetical protein
MIKNLSIHEVFVVLYSLAAVLTLIPRAGASKVSRLGYRALCSFSPFGTVVLVALAGLHLYLYLRATPQESA